ncbi:MAG: acyl-CoA dehydrogenase family protein [Thiolinea sp.]
MQSTAAKAGETLDVRSLCLSREILARHDALADFSFAMQGLGMGAVSLFGSPEQQQWLDKTRSGASLAAFALTEPASGSDVAHISSHAEPDGDGWVLNGEKPGFPTAGLPGCMWCWRVPRIARRHRGPKGCRPFWCRVMHQDCR